MVRFLWDKWHWKDNFSVQIYTCQLELYLMVINAGNHIIYWSVEKWDCKSVVIVYKFTHNLENNRSIYPIFFLEFSYQLVSEIPLSQLPNGIIFLCIFVKMCIFGKCTLYVKVPYGFSGGTGDFFPRISMTGYFFPMISVTGYFFSAKSWNRKFF